MLNLTAISLYQRSDQLAHEDWEANVPVRVHADETADGIALSMRTNPISVIMYPAPEVDEMVEVEIDLLDGSGRSLRVLGEVVSDCYQVELGGDVIPVVRIELWGVGDDARPALERFVEEYDEVYRAAPFTVASPPRGR